MFSNFTKKHSSAGRTISLIHQIFPLLLYLVSYNINILINTKTIFIASFSIKSLNYVGRLFDIFGKIKEWNSLKNEHLKLPQLSLQTAFFRFVVNLSLNLGLIQNHTLLIFRIYLYKARKYGRVSLNGLIKNSANVITIERNIANNDTKKIEISIKK